MSKLKQTEPNKLVGMLRSEVGEIIEAWIVLNIYDFKAYEMQTEDLLKDQENEHLNIVNIVRSKLRDDLISRLSELGGTKHGRLNFKFAVDKFRILNLEVRSFQDYLKKHDFNFRRNKNIAHKEISPKWEQIDPSPAIRKNKILRAIGMALFLMKELDHKVYGEKYRQIWKTERERRYDFKMPANAKYLLLPYLVGMDSESSFRHSTPINPTD